MAVSIKVFSWIPHSLRSWPYFWNISSTLKQGIYLTNRLDCRMLKMMRLRAKIKIWAGLARKLLFTDLKRNKLKLWSLVVNFFCVCKNFESTVSLEDKPIGTGYSRIASHQWIWARYQSVSILLSHNPWNPILEIDRKIEKTTITCPVTRI